MLAAGIMALDQVVSNKITIAETISPNLCDDIVYGRIAISLHAIGCEWECPDCHSKQLRKFNYKKQIEINADDFCRDWKDAIDAVGIDNITIVGTGGDFCFQLDNWLEFCSDIKRILGSQVRIVWYTGALAEDNGVYRSIISCKHIECVDAILWGRSESHNCDTIVKGATYAPYHILFGDETWKIKKVYQS